MLVAVCGVRAAVGTTQTLVTVLELAVPAVAPIVSVPAPPVSAYVNDACPLASVLAVPVTPALGPKRTVKVTVTPGAGVGPRVTVAVTVCDAPVMLVAVCGVGAAVGNTQV